MNPFIAFFQYELKKKFSSSAYTLCMVIFLLLLGIIYWLIAVNYAEIPTSNPNTIFFSAFWLPTLFIIPLLTMRSFAEDRRSGTWNLLLLSRLSLASIIGAKFLSHYLFYLFLWGLALFFPLMSAIILNPEFKSIFLDPSALFGGFLFIFLSSGSTIALGLFCSSLCKNQWIAGILSFTGLFFILTGSRLSEEIRWTNLTIYPLQTFDILREFCQGVLDSRAILFYLGTSLFFLFITYVVLDLKENG